MKLRALLVFVLFLSVRLDAAQEIGSYKIPEDVRVDSKVVSAGIYEIRIEHESDSAFIELITAGNVVAKEPAIVLPARGTGTTTVTSVKAGKRDFVRIRVRGEANWYIAYLAVEKPSTAFMVTPASRRRAAETAALRCCH